MWHSIQEQEDHDYQMGVASDAQNAYAWNSMNRKGDDPNINKEIAQGHFVIVAEGPEYCPSTDAVLGSRKILLSTHKTRDEATTALHAIDDPDPDLSIYILPPTPTYNQDEIPF